MTFERHVKQSRIWENLAFIVGVFLMAEYAIASTVYDLGFRLGPCDTTGRHGVPWVQIIVGVILVVPKTWGRTQGSALILGVVSAIRRRGVHPEVTLPAETESEIAEPSAPESEDRPRA